MPNIATLLIALRERIELGDWARASRIADAILRYKGYL